MQSGAPSYPVLLGRRDGFESNAASVNLPSPSISWQAALAFFKSKGLDVQDMSTLLGNQILLSVFLHLFFLTNLRKFDAKLINISIKYNFQSFRLY